MQCSYQPSDLFLLGELNELEHPKEVYLRKAWFISIVVNMEGRDKVGMKDFDLLKVLGTGGK